MLPQSLTSSRKGLRISLIAALIPLLAGGAAMVGKRTAHAEGAEADKAEVNERCATRLAISLTGKAADPAQLTAADPQASVDAMLASPEFADRYAGFVNAEFNGAPIAAANDDVIYYLAKHIIAEGMPWADLFTGPYDVVPGATEKDGMTVKDDANGLGYFHTKSWKLRFGGNEPKGVMLVAAFRMVQNTTGVDLDPSVGSPDDPMRDAKGRAEPKCKFCHYDAWFALDTIANLLPTKVVTVVKDKPDVVSFTPPTAGPQPLLGKTIKDDRELVSTLVASDAWKFNQCRAVFKFLYGRNENQCEAKTFDACVTALEEKKTIQSAVAAVAKDASFCTN